MVAWLSVLHWLRYYSRVSRTYFSKLTGLYHTLMRIKVRICRMDGCHKHIDGWTTQDLIVFISMQTPVRYWRPSHIVNKMKSKWSVRWTFFFWGGGGLTNWMEFFKASSGHQLQVAQFLIHLLALATDRPNWPEKMAICDRLQHISTPVQIVVTFPL